MKWPYPEMANGFDEGDRYGPRESPGGIGSTFHEGVDIGKRGGTPIPSSGKGKVVLSQYYGGLGNCVIVDHGNGIYTTYGHASVLVARVNWDVEQFQTLSLVGTTGASTGNHLHFGTAVGGMQAYIDPEDFIPRYADYANSDNEEQAAPTPPTPYNSETEQEPMIVRHSTTPGGEDPRPDGSNRNASALYMYIPGWGVWNGLSQIEALRFQRLQTYTPEYWNTEIETLIVRSDDIASLMQRALFGAGPEADQMAQPQSLVQFKAQTGSVDLSENGTRQTPNWLIFKAMAEFLESQGFAIGSSYELQAPIDKKVVKAITDLGELTAITESVGAIEMPTEPAQRA